MTGEQSVRRWLGVDFSGDHRKWRRSSRNSNICVGEVGVEHGRAVLRRLTTPQELPGDEAPFYRLRNFLKKREFEAAAIDAPFSVPWEYQPPGGHAGLLKLIAKIDRPRDWPFPAAGDFVDQVLAGRSLRPKKPLRRTECHWKCRNINVRSTLWAGPRGGAAMTSACLTLLREANCPIWPWNPTGPGLLVEAFPAAQLWHWNMPYQGYNGDSGTACVTREKIVKLLSEKIALGKFGQSLEKSADALDAVLCAFAAIAVTNDNLAGPLELPAEEEGQIAVHT